MRATPVVLLIAAVCACGGDEPVAPATSGPGAGGGGGDGAGGGGGGGSTTLPTTFGGDRPVELFVPSSYDGSPAPLLILLHGYSASGAVQDLYFGLKDQALARGMLYAHPDGTIDEMGNRFWNATDACCGFGKPVDDSAYLRGLIDAIAATYSVDDKRIYFMGHSNGSFMSYRMACDHADRVAAIAGLAGAMWDDPTKCTPSEPVHVLHLHGTDDTTIAYAGGDLFGFPYPGAEASVAFWASLSGCDAAAPEAPLDLVDGLADEETEVSRYTGCTGGSAEIWTIQGAGHIPSFNADATPAILDFLLAHPKP